MRFSEVIGHSLLKSRLLTAVSEGRVSHAQLFLGPEGSGALPMALAYAQYLLCRQPVAGDACGTCSSCMKAAKMVHPDITFSFPVPTKEKISDPRSIDFIAEFRESVLANPYLNYHDWITALELENKQGLIRIHEARYIIERLSLKSVEGAFRIVLMWYPEKMNVEAANCLLKILEEPEEKTVFLLVAENDETIPVTILSRTQLVKVTRLKDEEVLKGLSAIPGADSKLLQPVTHRAAGNFRMALNLLAEEDPDADLAETFLAWMRACLKLNVQQLQKLGDELAAIGRERQKGFFEYCLSVVRECLLMNYGDEKLVRIEGKEKDSFRKLAPFIHSDNADGFIRALDEMHYHVERNANFKIQFMDLSFRLNRLLNKKEGVS
ncbi:MAG: hypothetical protein RL213_986 [Bacteroidota bacterium]|jgi:DNA polymerase-3 subunit delta'